MMAKRKTRWIFLGALAGLVLFATIFLRNEQTSVSLPPKTISNAKLEQTSTVNIEKKPLLALADPSKAPAPPSALENSPIILTANNFEEMVMRCFQGKACELSEDPWKLYQEFKHSQHPHATDLLISYLRKQLKDPAFQEKYADALLAMIKDFYSPQELPFQMAAYYSYLGDLQKSLELYLDLEKRSQIDSSLRPAPKLNIANVYYDMHNCAAALPYYQAALDHYSAKHNIDTQTRDLMQFIEKRIEECRKL